jgi:heterotetrameric sarcosine oxidase gamma subunit
VADCTPYAKVLVRSAPDEQLATHGADVLVGCLGPGEWLVLAAPGTAEEVTERIRRHVDVARASIYDVTHAYGLLRVAGEASAVLLARLCAVDLGDGAVPRGASFRSLVAEARATVIREDGNGRNGGRERSYLVAADWVDIPYLFDVLLGAGADLGIDVDGFHFPTG